MKFFEKHKECGATVLRIFLGIAFLVAGLDKVLGMDTAKGMFTQMFGGAGAAMLYLAIAIELIGGLALLFNWHTMETSIVLTLFMLVALIKTFKLGEASNFVGTLRELLVMNTGGGNTAVNLAYMAGLVSLAFSGCKQCKTKK